MIRSQRAFRLGKEQGRCEDYVAGWKKEGRYALSDGATESFDSKNWAKALCWHFLRDEHFGVEWLAGARNRYNSRYPVDLDDWSAQHAFQRGSYATFLGLSISHRKLVAHGVGDTTLFICGRAADLTVFPAPPANGFGNNPDLLSSLPSGDSDAEARALSDCSLAVDAPSYGWYGTTLVAVTDSLAAWILKENTDESWSRLNELCGLRCSGDFYRLCHDAMKSRQLKRDDFTVLVLEL